MKRTHSNGELTIHDINKRVVLMGWVHTRRDHGGVIFVDLRDGKGMTQVVFNPKFAADVHTQAEALKREDVIAVEGIVKQRSKDQLNKAIITGEIEVFIEQLEIITRANTPPIEIDDRKPASDEKRLKYRYLDLRRPIMQRNLRMRHQILTSARDYLNSHDFIEVETPLLVKPTPEGARDYLVPSRINPGHFYALPQSPQLYKQILMIAGIGRYYQIARCLRDEDLRADRQPEFTQIDLEMSFVDEKDIMALVEGLYKHIFRKNLGIEFDSRFQVLTYKDAMERYG
jgi:aspartyl-tRNA synthetase